MFGIGKRLDVYFIKDLMFRRAHEELSKSMSLTLDEDDYITKKLLNRIRKNYEDCYNETIKLSKREFKRTMKARKKRAKLGEIDQNEEIALYLQQIGVEFLEVQEDSECTPEAEIEAETGEESKSKEEVETKEMTEEESKPEIDAETSEEKQAEEEDKEEEPGQEQGNTAE